MFDEIKGKIIGVFLGMAVSGGGVLVSAAGGGTVEEEFGKQVFSKSFEYGIVGLMFAALLLFIFFLVKIILALIDKLKVAIEANTTATTSLATKISEMGSAQALKDMLEDNPEARAALRAAESTGRNKKF